MTLRRWKASEKIINRYYKITLLAFLLVESEERTDADMERVCESDIDTRLLRQREAGERIGRGRSERTMGRDTGRGRSEDTTDDEGDPRPSTSAGKRRGERERSRERDNTRGENDKREEATLESEVDSTPQQSSSRGRRGKRGRRTERRERGGGRMRGRRRGSRVNQRVLSAAAVAMDGKRLGKICVQILK